MRTVLDSFDSSSRDTFPFNFTGYVEAHHSDLFDGFISLFSGTLSQNDLNVLNEFFQGGEGSEGGLGGLRIRRHGRRRPGGSGSSGVSCSS